MREPDAIAPNFLRSTFDLPRTDIDLVKVPTVRIINIIIIHKLYA